MLKVAKFGGSSMADAGQYQKIRDIIRSDPSRRVVVVSAAGKRSAGDNKITDLLYLCYAHLQYGVSCDGIYQMIRERYGDIHRELGLRVDLEGVLDRLRSQMEQGISRDELVSRGEYLSALLMADYLGFTFVDAAQWLFFHYDGTIDQEKSYAALRALAKDKCVVIPGSLEVLQHHPVNVDCPEVIFEDGNLLALCEQVGGILADEGGFPSPKNASNEVDCGHRASSFLRLIITKNRRKCNAKN